MTAKERLQQAVEELSEAEAADVLTLLDARALDGEAMTRTLDGIPGAYERVQQGLADARAGRTISLADFERGRR